MQPVMANASGQSAASRSLAYQFLECIQASSPGNLRRSRPAPRKASRQSGSAGPGWLQLTVLAGCHFNARSRPPVSALAGPSERARIRIPESAPIRSLLIVKAATLRHASKSPIQTAPAGSPATPRLLGFVKVLHVAPSGRHAGGVDFVSVRCWGGSTLTTGLREGSSFGSFRPPSDSSALRIEPPSFPSLSRRSTNSARRYHEIGRAHV